MDSLQPTKSLVQKTYEAILDEICIGSLLPGARLAQDDLAEQLDVSRQPVNGAIAMLKAQGFVIDTGRRGVVVAPIENGHFDAIYQFRSAVEPLAVELATPRMTKDAIVKGRTIIAQGKSFVQAGDAPAVLQADMGFHALIHQLSGNPIIIDTMHLNWRHLQRSMNKVLQFPGMSLHVWKEHKKIFEAMISGNAEEAAALMRIHIKHAPERISGQSD